MATWRFLAVLIALLLPTFSAAQIYPVYNTGLVTPTGGTTASTLANLFGNVVCPSAYGSLCFNSGVIGSGGFVHMAEPSATGVTRISPAPGPLLFTDLTNTASDQKHGLAGAMYVGLTDGTISNAVNNGSGLCRITLGSTEFMHTGDAVTVENIVGATECNGSFTITVVSQTQIDLTGTTFSSAYTSGGDAYDTSSSVPHNSNQIAFDSFSLPDDGGDSSTAYFRQTGGGNALSVFNLSASRPASATQYQNTGYGIEVAVDGGKKGVNTVVQSGTAFAGVVENTNGAGLSILPGGTDTSSDSRRAIHVATADNSTEKFYVDLAGNVFTTAGLGVNATPPGSGSITASGQITGNVVAAQNSGTASGTNISSLESGLASGGFTGFGLGVADSNFNSGVINFNYTGGSGSKTNYISLSLFGVGGLEIDGAGHLISSVAGTPVLTSCGTGSPAITGNDVRGMVTEGTTATGCTITFAVAYGSAPFCTVSSPNGAALTSYSTSATALTIVNASATGDTFTYNCVQ